MCDRQGIIIYDSDIVVTWFGGMVVNVVNAVVIVIVVDVCM